MSLTVTEEAAKWYIDEMGLESGQYVHFFVKLYGGIPTAYSNYFLGVSVGKDGEIGISDEVEGVTFYFTQQDKWFLEAYHLTVEMGEEEAVFEFTPVNE